MQQNQPERRFTDPPNQPVYRFPQNQTMQGWKPQQSFSANGSHQEVHLSARDRKELKRAHKRRKRRIFTLWNLFAVIGMITVLIQAARYIVIPLLVQLNILSGGAL